MPCNPGASFFVPFHKLDLSEGNQCIYFTRKGSRCRIGCSQEDHAKGLKLRNTITARETTDLELIYQYILLKCCKRGQHRYFIQDAELLGPLALRWQDEISRYRLATLSVHCTLRLAAHMGPLTSVAGSVTDLNTPVLSRCDQKLNSHSAFINNVLRAESIVASACPEPTRSPIADELDNRPTQTQTRYSLRSREVNVVDNSTLTEPALTIQPSSEFRAHKTNSRPADSVFSKMNANLRKEDYKTGWLYIFDRASSPGYVKIGWTAVSVQGRLDQWAKCGYTPNLIFSMGGIPHAKRVETLVHHELIVEWRRERRCKGVECGKSHKEWFEISRERATHVVRSWAKFMYEAQPYDSEGRLKSQWREIVERMDWRGELVTGQRMLQCFHESVPKVLTLVFQVPLTNNQSRLSYQLKFDEAPRRRNPLLIEGSSSPKTVTAQRSTESLKAHLSKEIPLFKTEAPFKSGRGLEGVSSPSQAVFIKQEAPCEQLALKKALLKFIDSLGSEVPMGRANPGSVGVGKRLENEATRLVPSVA